MLTGWLKQLQQRRVFRALAGYGVVSFAILQVVEPVMHGLGLPEWVLGTTVVALGIGFPITLILAWIFDVQGSRIEATGPRPSARMLLLLAAAGLALGAPGVGWYFWKQHRAAAGAMATGASAPASRSIAVLPFVNLSSDKEQEYFSDGISEEILDALTRIKGLKVAGRTSSFHFKGRNDDLRTIGGTLGVANLLEGSVRKQGKKVRITAQLIQVSDGFHLWSRTFDGELNDVFELQERIARGITDELKVVLQGDPRDRLVPVATREPEAYALYLQATAVLNQRDYPRMRQAIEWLEQAVKLDPGYARAHARLAMLHALGFAQYGSSFDKGEREARLAVKLDSSLGEPWTALGLIALGRRQFMDARTAFDRAFELDPNDSFVNLHGAQALIMTGYTRQGIEGLDRTLALDPVLPNALFWRGVQFAYAGDEAAAVRALERARSLGLSFAVIGLAEVARIRGDTRKARSLAAAWPLTDAEPCVQDPAAPASLRAAYYGADAEENARAEAAIAACLATKPTRISIAVDLAALQLGPPARALELIAAQPSSNDAGLLEILWGTSGRAARRSPAFAAFARRLGYADLWEKYGPPDGCRRVAPREYACD